MLVFRNIATAFLMNGNDFLMMERSKENNLFPGFYYGVGGHLEPEELNNPRIACLREIYEETGIQEKEIEDLKLKYILLKRSYNETVMNYVYFGYSKTRIVVENDEGTLHWVKKEEAVRCKLIDAFRITLAHYLKSDISSNDVLVGVVNSKNNVSQINWSVLQDMKDSI